MSDENEKQIKVEFGNRSAVHYPIDHSDPEKAAKGEGERRRLRVRGVPELITTVTGAPGAKVSTVFLDLTHPEHGAVVKHFDGKPTWVASNSPALADLLAEEYGCEVRPFDEERHANPLAHCLAAARDAKAKESE